jgi:hypothetical protein
MAGIAAAASGTVITAGAGMAGAVIAAGMAGAVTDGAAMAGVTAIVTAGRSGIAAAW